MKGELLREDGKRGKGLREKRYGAALKLKRAT
jgi:hypothetical protein